MWTIESNLKYSTVYGHTKRSMATKGSLSHVALGRPVHRPVCAPPSLTRISGFQRLSSLISHTVKWAWNGNQEDLTDPGINSRSSRVESLPSRDHRLSLGRWDPCHIAVMRGRKKPSKSWKILWRTSRHTTYPLILVLLRSLYHRQVTFSAGW